MLVSVQLTTQDQGQIRIYSLAAFGSDLAIGDANYQNGERGFKKGLGLNGGVEYFVVDNISVNAAFTQYFKTNGNQIIIGAGSRNWFTASYMNLNGKYYVDNGTSWIQTYGLAGLAYYNWYWAIIFF